MAVNSYAVVRVKTVISASNPNIIGDKSIQAVCEWLGGGMQIYAVNESLYNIIQDGDLAIVDQGMVGIQNSNEAFPKNEIIKIVRNKTAVGIENLIKDTMSKLPKPSGLSG